MESDFVALLADESPDAAIIMTAEGKVVHWKKGAKAIFGFTQCECLARTVGELIVPENRADDERRFFDETLQGRYATFEFLRRRKTVRWSMSTSRARSSIGPAKARR
jgi:PAS domain S-box-containing protein